jgi:hypothetical protein
LIVYKTLFIEKEYKRHNLQVSSTFTLITINLIYHLSTLVF